MKIIILICFLFIGSAGASTDYRELKKGFIFGAELNVGAYSFPEEFTGIKKNKLDDSATIIDRNGKKSIQQRVQL
jgi:hypothetical protein